MRILGHWSSANNSSAILSSPKTHSTAKYVLPFVLPPSRRCPCCSRRRRAECARGSWLQLRRFGPVLLRHEPVGCETSLLPPSALDDSRTHLFAVWADLQFGRPYRPPQWHWADCRGYLHPYHRPAFGQQWRTMHPAGCLLR